MRADLNVPIENGEVTDDFRIEASLPLLGRLRASQAVTTVCSHLGRPKDREPEFRMDPVAARLAELGGFSVRKLDVVAGPDAEAAVAAAAPGDVLLLENTRFEPGETRNDLALGRALSRLCDLFVLDAFGSAHRAHASTVGVTEHVRSVAGPLLLAEVESLSKLLHDPERPFVVLLGGAKVSDKLGVINSLLPRVDSMLIGGGMCFTLLAARGLGVGNSLLEEDRVGEVRHLLEGEHGSKLKLPTDVVVADRFAEDALGHVVAVDAIEDGWAGLDIGPATASSFAEEIATAATVFWNGPMGIFEWGAFRSGTAEVARVVAGCPGFTVVGGGDSVAAMRLLGLDQAVDHLSSGGGAGLEMLEGKTLPGVAALERWSQVGG